MALVSLSRKRALEVAQSQDQPRIVLIRGLPGSGKSTLAKEFVGIGYKHIESDMYFFVHGRYIFRRASLAAAHKWCLSATKLALERGERVVVSNVFSKLFEMAPYLKLANSHVVIELIDSRENIHRASPTAISNLQQKWQNVPS